MSRRPTDWSPVDRSRDPVPGDPDVVEAAGKHYVEVAEAIELAARRLRELSHHDSMKGKAVDEVREKADDVAGDIERAHTRYAAVGKALKDYAGPLRTAQERADGALAKAVTAESDLRAARGRQTSAQDALTRARQDDLNAAAGAPPADHSHLEQSVRTADQDVSTAEGTLRWARGEVDEAEDDWERAARTARDLISPVLKSNGLDDGWRDNISKFVATLAKWAGAIAAACGIAALLVGWIPVIGQALAAVLGAIALVAGIVSLLANFFLAANGYGDWSAVVLDVIGLASFGIGRAVLKGSQAAYRGANASARMRAGTIAARSPGSRIPGGLPGSSATAIRSLLGGAAPMSRAQARSALAASNSVSNFSFRAPFVTALDDLRSIPSNLGTVFNRTNFGNAWAQTPGALSALRHPGNIAGFAGTFTGNGAMTDFAAFMQRTHPEVLKGVDLTRAFTLTGAMMGTTVGSGFLDSFQFATFLGDLGDGGPAGELNLDTDFHFDVRR